MGILEIVLLAAGAIIFLVSFCIPVKEEKLKEETRNLAAEEVKILVEEELERVRGRLSEISEEEVKERIGKSERTMERISNEKIMAVNEYSDTVLEEIHKNHEEVVFLYDVLKNKKESLSASYGKADQNLQELLQQVKDSEITVREKLGEISEKQKEIEDMRIELISYIEREKEQAAILFRSQKAAAAAVPKAPETPEAETAPVQEKAPEESGFKPFAPEKVEVVTKKARPKRTLKKPEPEKAAPVEDRNVSLLFSDTMNDSEEENQNNRRILDLHKAGKSNMAIARELGLGIGEVQLVIDLYEGFK